MHFCIPKNTLPSNPSSILLVRPASFGFNAETASSNRFQHSMTDMDKEAVTAVARKEFDEVVSVLKSLKLDIKVAEDSPEPEKPDAVFPNNWLSFHEDGTVVFYPMMATNRRAERRWDILENILDNKLFEMKRLLDYSKFEQKRKYLEGTGSLVFDREYDIAYACLSPRTEEELVVNLCADMKIDPFIFEARDSEGKEIYHTNVILTITQEYAIVCSEAITDERQQEKLLYKLAGTGKSIIEINQRQMKNFCGNCLELFGPKGESYLIMSSTAYQGFGQQQLADIGRFSKIVTLHIPTIEYYGGGSARCMICEIS